MKILIPVLFFLLNFSSQNLTAQLILNADGQNNTYDLISSKLAPGHNPIEVPDCGHTNFGDHIDEIFDDELNEYVFRFFIHTDDDDDRCINFDRQRNEIKSYDKSPDSLKGIQGEVVEYKWKFKLADGFQSSPKFTHIHQLKAVGGTESSMPLVTLTTRKGSPDELELRYAEALSQETLKEVDLAPFIGTWCEATETVTYGESGTYEMIIKRVADNTTLFSYSNDNIRMWKTQAEFIRPKWGIYRSLVFAEDLRDEEVLFANFSILESPSTVATISPLQNKIQLYPNPIEDIVQIDGIDEDVFFEILDSSGIKVLEGYTKNYQISLSKLPKAIYVINLSIDKYRVSKRLIKQ